MRQSLFLLSFVAFLLPSCNQHTFYAPNTMHLPTTKYQGEASVEASLNGSNQIKGGELRGSYCFAPKTSVMLNYMYLFGSFDKTFFGSFPAPPSERHSGRGFITELGITRHFPISEYTDFTLTGGYGLGRSVNDYDRNRIATLNFNRAFLQPAIVSKGELADFGIGLRFSRLAFQSASIDYRIDEQDIVDLQEIEADAPFFIPDLGLSAGINFAPIHIKCNVVLSLSDNIRKYSFAGNNLSVSLLYDIDQFVNKKKMPASKKKNSKKKK